MIDTFQPDRLDAALKHHQLCVVAHRLPLEHHDDEGWQRAPGGLVSALEPTLRERGGRWFGYTRTHGADFPRRRGHAEYVPLESEEARLCDAIDGCCNRTLWPALHGIDGNVEERDEWWTEYFVHNNRTAGEVACRARAGALVWVHDYHFYGVASELKRLRRDVHVGLFCHTPVEGAALAALSRGPQLLRHLSRFDVIGTQTERDADQLRRQFRRLAIGDRVPIHAVPVGIDVDTWSGYRDDAEIDRIARTHSAGAGRLAVGVDRADYSKGLIAKLLAFEVALETGTVEPDDLRLVQIATQTRAGIPAYDHVFNETLEISARINQSFTRSDDRRVVEIVTRQQSSREVAALMRAADVMLITPLRDGMNLVALEAAIVNADRPTEVVLSRDAGAAQHIGDDCRLVSGADVLSIADALRDVVNDSTSEVERRDRAARRARSAAALSARAWVDRSIDLLARSDLHHPVLERARAAGMPDRSKERTMDRTTDRAAGRSHLRPRPGRAVYSSSTTTPRNS